MRSKRGTRRRAGKAASSGRIPAGVKQKRASDRRLYRSLVMLEKARIHRETGHQPDRRLKLRGELVSRRGITCGPFSLSEFQFLLRVRMLGKGKINRIRTRTGLPPDKLLSSRVLAQQLVQAHGNPLVKPLVRWQLACRLFRNVKDYTPPGSFPRQFEQVRHRLLRKLVTLMNHYSASYRTSARRERWHAYLARTGLGEYFNQCRKQGLLIQI